MDVDEDIDIDYHGVVDSEGIPTGLGLVSYVHDGNENSIFSFRGACNFVKGVITGAGFFIQQEKETWLFEDLRNGIINGPCKFFYGDDELVTIDSTSQHFDVSNKLIYIGYTSNKTAEGFGRGFKVPNGGIFTGEWDKNLKVRGELSEIQPDGSRSVFNVEYDFQNDVVRGLWHENQVPITKVHIN